MSADAAMIAGAGPAAGTGSVAPAAAPNRVLTFGGRFPPGIRRWAYVPFDVPTGARRITVHTWYGRFRVLGSVAGNVLDIGIFGPPGWGAGDSAGYRGWSGGARTWFTISQSDATPGYLAGPLKPGRWAVALGPVVLNPLGMRWRVRVEIDCGESPDGAPVRLAPRAPRPDATRGTGWYRGDLHLHTVHSDGQRTPAELAAAARAAGLDFIASTDHNTSAANRAWSQLRYAGLTVLPGQEVTTRHGHWLAIGTPTGCSVDWRYSPRDGVFAGHARQVRERGGLVVAAHPAVPLPSAAWEFGFRHVDAVEVWNGRWGVDDEATLRLWHRLLRRGQRVAAVGGSDSHTPRQPVGRPQTVVHATDLSTPALLAGLRQGRSYLAESSGVVLRLAARPLSAAGTPAGAQVGTQPRAEIGEALRLPSGTRILVTASVTGVPGTRLTLLTAAGRLASTRISAAGTHHLHAIVDSGVARFVRAEVRRGAHRGVPAPMVALSNPVWLLAG